MKTKLLDLDIAAVKMADEGYQFSGYASVFNGVDAYGDRIAPGAYARTLKARDRAVQMRWNHFGPVIGKWKAIREDAKGLYVEGELTPGHSKAEDAYALLKHGAVSGLSIGYSVKAYEEDEDVRVLKDIELYEISVVEEPADNAARVSEVKNAIKAANTFREIEAILRDEGRFSRTDAEKLVQRVKDLAHGEREKTNASKAAADRLHTLIQNIGGQNG